MSHNENPFLVPALRSLWWSRLVRRFADKLEIPQAALYADEAVLPHAGHQAPGSGNFTNSDTET